MSRRTRVIAAAIMAPVAIAAVLLLPTRFLAALVAALMMVGLWEWTTLAGLRERIPRAAYLLGNALLMVALTWGAGRGLFTLKLVSVLGAAWWLLALVWLARFEFGARDTAWACMLKLAVGSICVIPAWAALCVTHADGPDGPIWALFALVLVWFADSGAYFTGSRFGKRKLAPRVSPGKSWEGLWGGVAASLLLAVAAMPVLHLDWDLLPRLLALAAITILASVVGDLFESLMKRHAGAKDSSHLIPGHGGVLDRIDSLLAALPVFVVAKGWFGL
ncbi:MAG: phosphatidate cytidylyltransferase [Pseudoxanthomonas sp.]